MGQFLFIAALLCLLAVAFAVSALWQKSRALALAVAVFVCAGSAALYWAKGTPVALDAANVQAPTTIDGAIAQLERLTRADPKNSSDQIALARAYMAKERFADADAAYARAMALLPDEASLGVERAESMLRASKDRRFPPAAVAMLERARQADPANQRALFFLGLHLRQNGRNAEAVATWEKLLAQIGPDASPSLTQQIASARADAGMAPAKQSEALLQVRVEIDPTLLREASPDAVLYVFARSAAGGPPVAVKRLQPSSWPVTVALGDEDSPMPTARLSEQSSVAVVARLSKSGLATASSGDLESEPVQVEASAGAAATLRLDRTVP
jgi:cytochrome c-type biogenesis protein CcmH